MKNERLYNALQMIEDALMQGRQLDIKFSFNYDECYEADTIDIIVEERVLLSSQHIFSDCNLETMEKALIAIGENL